MKHSIRGRALSVLLVLTMVFSVMPLGVFAGNKGEISTDFSTGLTGNINTNDTISLPIKILDYENDGMLFEYAESKETKSAGDFGATWSEDYAKLTAVGGSVNTGNYWRGVSLSLGTGTYANYIRMSWAKNVSGNNNENWTGSRAGVLLTDFNGFNDNDSANMEDIRYAVLVYRLKTDGELWLSINNSNGAAASDNHHAKFTITKKGDAGDGSEANWTYAVFDLKTGGITDWTTTTGIYAGLPLDESGEYMDIAHVAYFSDYDCAKAFGEYALTDGSDRGDNRAFGLLRSSRKQTGKKDSDGEEIYDDAFASVRDHEASGAIEEVIQINTYGKDPFDLSTGKNDNDYTVEQLVGYTLYGTFGTNGIANLGLLESTLSEDGYPVYKEEVVSYLAYLLQYSLEIPERTTDGWKNYRYVKGTASSVYGGTDLATAIRNRIKTNTTSDKLGNYSDTSKKNLIGTWSKVSGNITTYFDAAYFLLNSIFVSGSYNEPQNDYNYLVLSAGTDTKTDKKAYVFDGGFTIGTDSSEPDTIKSAVEYNTTAKTIQNSSLMDGKARFFYDEDSPQSTTTLNPFLPITTKNNSTGQTNTTYYQDDGVINTVQGKTTQDTLKNRNYNFALVSEGNFVYHEDDELFFDFEGDDDVYLFINGELVMDIGSAHSIDSVRFELNDYVRAAKAGTLDTTNKERNDALKLEDGETYTFKFYYMERHSYGSNMRIMTNIRVTDPKMDTEKTAWQDGSEIAYGGIIDKDKVIEYGFYIKNNGVVNLYNLIFDDGDIGVRLDYTNGLTVKDGYNGSRVFDLNGGTLDVTDLVAVVSHPNYEDITVTFDSNEELEAFLADLTGDGLDSNNKGLFSGATVLIRGIGYKLTEKQIEDAVFENTVNTWATGNGEILQGNDNMRVFVPSDPMYYQWAGHNLVVSKDKFIGDVLSAAKSTNNTLNNKVPDLSTGNVTSLELVSKGGGSTTSENVTVTNEKITINYKTPGSYIFYVKVTYTHESEKQSVIVPVLVNVTDVADSYIVLDYGLPVEIKLADISQNDTLTVAGRTTTSSIIAIGGVDEKGENGSYTPNEITFTPATGNKIEGTFGTFEFNGETQTITYTPTSFIEGEDSIQIALNVYECESPSNITGILNINKEVEMYKTITIIPATVMYYEDNFTSSNDSEYNDIKYLAEDIEVIKSDGEYIQSADQTEVYGHDDVYAKDSTYVANTGDDKELVPGYYLSGGSLRKIEITGNELLTFTFYGTGFELIARTDASSSGSIYAKGEAKKGDKILEVDVTKAISTYGLNSGVTKWTYPVIMEFDQGNDGGVDAIHQVPVIRVDGLEPYWYTVTVKGIQAYQYDADGKVKTDGEGNKVTKTTYLYFDGLRIFNPYDGEHYSEYLDTEEHPEFLELRNAISDGNVGVAKDEDNALTFASGTMMWAENLNATKKEYNCYEVKSVDEYLFRGPNNEVYMIGDDSSGYSTGIVFYVKETEGATAHSLQIALRALDLGNAFGTTCAGLSTSITYGVENNGTYGWTPLVTSISSTEQYYTIDYKNCHYDEGKGGYMVVLKAKTGMVSYSSLKLVGLELMEMDGVFDEATFTFTEGTLYEVSDESQSFSLLSISRQMDSTIIMTPNGTLIINPTDPELPEDPDTDDGDSDENETKYDSVVPILDVLTLTVRAGEGGSISPEGDLYIAFGAGRTFKITADEGYEIEDVLVNGKSVGAVEKYTIKAATTNTTVEAKFRKIG